MSSLRRGDIVLVPFPFTHLQAQKVRPAVVLSPKPSRQGDIIVAFISSVLPTEPAEEMVLLAMEDRDFATTGLKVSSVFRLNKLITLHTSLVLRRLGHSSPHLQQKLDHALTKALGLNSSHYRQKQTIQKAEVRVQKGRGLF